MVTGVDIAVVGATGLVGQEFLRILEHHPLRLNRLKLLASKRSAGTNIKVRGRSLRVEEATPESFDGIDFAFISVSGEVSSQLAPEAVKRGALVIDDSAAFRMKPEVPLVIPEVNGSDVEWHKGIIAIPNCSTTQLVMALYPLHRANPLKRVLVSTYQSVSGAGKVALDELRIQTEEMKVNGPSIPAVFPFRIASNVIPQIGHFDTDGYSEEESKIIEETRKILHDPDIKISATCVRVPVTICHSESVNLEFTDPMGVREAYGLLNNMPGLKVMDGSGLMPYPMPWDLQGTDEVYVGRLRRDFSVENGLALWVVADNLRKGAALNAIQIAEEVLNRRVLKKMI